ncbi:MAG: hypothetical protein QHH75_06190 [Bacillota bacterium]|nr:hypothetical protein [Bacillota bacterium]
MEVEKAITKWRSYLVERGFSVNKEGRLSTSYFESLLQQVYQFMVNFYDDREEF